MPRPRFGPLLALLAAVSLVPAGARASDPANDSKRYLNSAIRLYQSLDYEKAVEQLRLAKQLPHSADDDVTLALYEGILLFELGQPGGGESFRTALSLSPDAQLPEKVAPQIRAAFDAERARMKKAKPLRQPEPSAPAATTQGSAGPGRAWWALAPLVVGVAAVGTGGYFLAETSRRYQALEDGTAPAGEAVSYRDEGDRDQVIGWTLAGAGAALAVTGLVLLLVPPGQDAPPVTVAPTFDGHGGSLSVGGTFW